MSYHIYKTKGIVIDEHERSEANKALYLLTHEFGLVLATAQSVRALKSKLRYALQVFSYSDIDLVKGKSGWRVVNAHYKENFLNRLSGEEAYEKRCTVGRITGLVRRLVKGEEQNEKLFIEVVNILSFIRDTELSEKKLFSAEVIAVMRILNLLGYWGEHEELASLLKEEGLERYDLDEVFALKPLAIREINKSLRETQL
ncbi:MAG: recombination protein O N-terminal domain-containing protein [Candidatus Paceibacterota bacterium]